MDNKKRTRANKALTDSERNVQHLEKQAAKEHQNRIKPGNCLKYIKVNIDPSILSNSFGSQILSSLATLGVEATIEPQEIAEIIAWRRSVQQEFSKDEPLRITSKFINEKCLLYVMLAKELNHLITTKALIVKFQQIIDIHPDNHITLLICGLKEYCRMTSNVGRLAFESDLIKLQILLNISHRFLDTAADMANTVMQFSKSVAELPYKKQEAEKLKNQNFFVTNDNKDCVTVKGVTGLSNLWQHHLIKFPLVTLEIAEAIISEYPMPKVLLEAYNDTDDGANLLANIPVRRAGGPLTSIRRIGPELSKKLYTMYTNSDPNHVV